MFKRKDTESKMSMNEEEDSHGHIEGNLASLGLQGHQEVSVQHQGVAFSSGLLWVWDEVSSAEASFESF